MEIKPNKRKFTFSFIFGDFSEKIRHVNDNTVAEEGFAIGQNNAGRKKVEGKVGITNNDSVASVVAAGATGNNVNTFGGEKIDKFP